MLTTVCFVLFLEGGVEYNDSQNMQAWGSGDGQIQKKSCAVCNSRHSNGIITVSEVERGTNNNVKSRASCPDYSRIPDVEGGFFLEFVTPLMGNLDIAFCYRIAVKKF